MHLMGFQAACIWTCAFPCLALLLELLAESVTAVVYLILVETAEVVSFGACDHECACLPFILEFVSQL